MHKTNNWAHKSQQTLRNHNKNIMLFSTVTKPIELSIIINVYFKKKKHLLQILKKKKKKKFTVWYA